MAVLPFPEGAFISFIFWVCVHSVSCTNVIRVLGFVELMEGYIILSLESSLDIIFYIPCVCLFCQVVRPLDSFANW